MVIDASRASRVRAGDLDRLGLYANVAARLAEHAVSVEDRVGLLVYAERALSACLPDRGLRAVTRLRHALEAIETRRGEPDPVPAAIQVVLSGTWTTARRSLSTSTRRAGVQF